MVLTVPPGPAWCGYVLAHGAGAGMHHPFLESLAAALSERDIATVRYQFPYMEQGRKRVDPPGVAQAAVRAATAWAADELPGLPLLAGGKSFGGRMTSQAQAEQPLPGVLGLAFLGFPLHPPGRPGIERAEHLQRVRIPLLFLQGTRDEFADPGLLREVVGALGERATLRVLEGGDHSFAVRKSSGRTAADVRNWLADEITAFARRFVPSRR